MSSIRVIVEGLGMPHVVSRQQALRLVFLFCTLTEDSLLARGVRDTFPSLITTPVCSEVECRPKPRNQSQCFTECREALSATSWSSGLSRPRKALYQELMEIGVSDPSCGATQLVRN